MDIMSQQGVTACTYSRLYVPGNAGTDHGMGLHLRLTVCHTCSLSNTLGLRTEPSKLAAFKALPGRHFIIHVEDPFTNGAHTEICMLICLNL